MPCVPHIDQPCPLPQSELRRVGGFCSHCRRTVHVLDGLDDTARRELLRRADGPICVSYRVGAGLGAAALALSLAATPASAAPPAAAHGHAPPALLAPAAVVEQALPGTRTAMGSTLQSPLQPAAETPPECGEEEDRIEVMGGGVSRPEDAAWLEQDSALPDLPMRDAPTRHPRAD
jgi:hypothetical protein